MNQIGWRICKGTQNKTGGFNVSPLFPCGKIQSAVVGTTLEGTHHVGTSQEFVTDYYAGITELGADEFEFLLELECTQIQKDHQDRWGWPAGSEAVVADPIILNITILGKGPRN